MSCRKVRRDLFGYFRQELSIERMQEIRIHLESCPECAKEAEQTEKVILMLREGLETLVPSTDFDEKLLIKIRDFPSVETAPESKNWWIRFLHEIFPSMRIRWALAGAISVVILAWVIMFGPKETSIYQKYLSQNEGRKENQSLVSSGKMVDSLYQKRLEKAVKAYASRAKTFVIDKFTIPANRGEDGWIRPEDLYKRFVIERRSSFTNLRGRDSFYILPVMSTQFASQRRDF